MAAGTTIKKRRSAVKPLVHALPTSRRSILRLWSFQRHLARILPASYRRRGVASSPCTTKRFPLHAKLLPPRPTAHLRKSTRLLPRFQGLCSWLCQACPADGRQTSGRTSSSSSVVRQPKALPIVSILVRVVQKLHEARRMTLTLGLSRMTLTHIGARPPVTPQGHERAAALAVRTLAGVPVPRPSTTKFKKYVGSCRSFAAHSMGTMQKCNFCTPSKYSGYTVRSDHISDISR